MTCGEPAFAGACTLVALGFPWVALSGTDDGSADIDTTALLLPDLAPDQEAGRKRFDANGAGCLRLSVSGSERGPSLVQRIYEPDHNGDRTFLPATRLQVPAHHGQVGNMPTAEDVAEDEVIQIAAYLRAPTQANEIK